MLGWIIRVLLLIAGMITSWFVARDALNFNIVQMVVAVCLITIVILIITFWPFLKKYWLKIIKWNTHFKK